MIHWSRRVRALRHAAGTYAALTAVEQHLEQRDYKRVRRRHRRQQVIAPTPSVRVLHHHHRQTSTELVLELVLVRPGRAS